MKFQLRHGRAGDTKSLPVRGAWVEIMLCVSTGMRVAMSLPVRGAWVEMLFLRQMVEPDARRSPCGERGLKFALADDLVLLLMVAPRAGSVG